MPNCTARLLPPPTCMCCTCMSAVWGAERQQKRDAGPFHAHSSMVTWCMAQKHWTPASCRICRRCWQQQGWHMQHPAEIMHECRPQTKGPACRSCSASPSPVPPPSVEKRPIHCDASASCRAASSASSLAASASAAASSASRRLSLAALFSSYAWHT